MNTPTPEEFLLLAGGPEDDVDDFEAGPSEDDWADAVTDEPLVSIAHSLRRLVEITEGGAPAAPVTGIVTQEEFDELARAYDDLEANCETLHELLREIEGIVKPSTSRLANSVREVIRRWRDPEVPAVEPEPEPQEEPTPDGPRLGDVGMPAHDAPVEDWREFARSLGYADAPPSGDGVDVDSMNRSQIRTMLGIPHAGQA